MARVRVHQHVNPLSPYYRLPPRGLDLAAAFADPERALHIDVGCARGRFLLRLAEIKPEWNFLGVEIREPLVNEANQLAEEAGLTNLHYSFCNAMIWLGQLLQAVPPGRLQMATIQFPDPWFKKKHAKRRMVNAELVSALTDALAVGGQIYVQTDIEFLFEEIAEIMAGEARLHAVQLPEKLFGVKTEREISVERRGLPVYRRLFEKHTDRIITPSVFPS